MQAAAERAVRLKQHNIRQAHWNAAADSATLPVAGHDMVATAPGTGSAPLAQASVHCELGRTSAHAVAFTAAPTSFTVHMRAHVVLAVCVQLALTTSLAAHVPHLEHVTRLGAVPTLTWKNPALHRKPAVVLPRAPAPSRTLQRTPRLLLLASVHAAGGVCVLQQPCAHRVTPRRCKAMDGIAYPRTGRRRPRAPWRACRQSRTQCCT
jgi:hypothetical protein